MRKTARPAVWEGDGAQSPSLRPIQGARPAVAALHNGPVKVSIYYIGKPRDASANAMAEEYVKRTSRYLPCEMREIRPGRFDPWARHPSATKILLDAEGRAMDSAAFIALVSKAEME